MNSRALKIISASILMTSAWGLTGCTRPTSTGAVLKIRTPYLSEGQNSGQGVALPTNKKVCYGVNVVGAGITDASIPNTSCSHKLGALGGFVAEGEELSVEVPKGTGRKLELFVYLADSGTSCPAISPSVFSQNMDRVIPSGKIENLAVTDDQQSVVVNLDFPGEAGALAQTCVSPASLRASLSSAGDLLDAVTGQVLTMSTPVAESAYISPLQDLLSAGILTSGGVVNIPTAEYSVPGYVTSLTRRPDTGELFGLFHDGTIAKLDTTANPWGVVALTSSTCPFQVPNCQVPPWMQSISAGYGGALFGLDHGGSIYALTSTGAIPTTVKVPDYIVQVSFY